LAIFTLTVPPKEFPWHVNVTKPEEIDCAFEATDSEMERFHQALDCYVTYADVIAATKIHDVFRKDVQFEIYREEHKPPLEDLFQGLENR
jgi:N-acetylglucosamine malate deacetylase 2